jgi:hypothetical protein
MKQTRKIFEKRFTLDEVLELRPADARRVRSLLEDKTVEALIEESGNESYRNLAYDAVGCRVEDRYIVCRLRWTETSNTD